MPQTLLLADDSVTIQRVIELTFADEDIKVIAVSDGDQAIARIESAPPDIVLADIGMPGRNGYEVAQYVKRSPHLSHIPVVLLTGAFEPVDQAKAADAGCDGVLAKPFEPQLVIARVKELLGKARSVPDSVDATLGLVPNLQGEEWAAPLGGRSFSAAEPPKAPADPTRLDNYFDQLDAAFAMLGTPPMGEPPAPSAPAPPDEIDWFGARSTADPAAPPRTDLPLSYPPAPDVASPAAPRPAPTIAQAPPPAPAPPAIMPSAMPPAGPSLPVPLPPPLGDAFAALLAAEQNQPLPPLPPAWPSATQSAAVVTDDLVERVARRVLERLSDQIVRETVADIVSKVAERLAREEIERIKAAIK